MVKLSRRRGTRGSRRGRQRKGSGIVGRVRAVASRVRQLERTKEETKHIIYSDQGVTGSSILFGLTGWNIRQNNPFIKCLNVLDRGLTVQDRIGDHAVFTKIRGRITCYFGTSVVSDTWVKWRLVQQYRPQGTLLATSTYFDDTYGVSTPVTRGLLPNINNKDQRVRYKTIKQGTLVVTGLSDQSQEERYIDIDWYGKGIHTNYSLGNSGGVSDIDKNAIYLIMWTNSAITTNGVGLYGEMQCFYHG